VGIASNGLGDESGPIGWQSFFPHVQISLDRHYGSVRALEDARTDTRRWIHLVLNHTTEVENGLGDWMATDMLPVKISGRIFLIEALRAWAVLTDSKEEQLAALSRVDEELNAFQSRFVKENGDIVWQGSHPTQSGQAMAIFFNLIQSPRLQALVEESLVRTVETAQRHITTGMFGILPLFESLSKINQTSLAWDIIMQKDFPSYGYMLKNNATTLWESWFFSDDTFSHNHPMFSGVISWILSHIGGITVAKDAIGADRLIMAPRPPDGSGLSHADMSLETARGLAICRWKCTVDGRMHLSIHCPANTRCLVVLPDGSNPFEVGGGKFTYNIAASACGAVPVDVM
jgi:alpha-L-rhamnosidase